MFAFINMLDILGYYPTLEWAMSLVCFLRSVPMFVLLPRFILSIRELYAQDVQGRRGEGIDTGFGLSASSRSAVRTALRFADIEQNASEEDVEEVPMRVRTYQLA